MCGVDKLSMTKDFDSHDIKWIPEKVSRLWGYYAANPAYKQYYFSYHSGKSILQFVKKYVSFSNKEILDFGCGPGYLIDYLLKEPSNKVYGLDFSEESISKVNEKFKYEKRFGGAVSTKELPSPFPDNSKDVIFSVEVVEHLNDVELTNVLKDIYRVLKPGGYVIVTTANKEDLEAEKTICPDCGCVFHRWQHLRVWDASALKEVMEKTGFNTIHVSDAVFGSLARRLYYLSKKLFTPLEIIRQRRLTAASGNQSLTGLTKGFEFPRLIYIGRK